MDYDYSVQIAKLCGYKCEHGIIDEKAMLRTIQIPDIGAYFIRCVRKYVRAEEATYVFVRSCCYTISYIRNAKLYLKLKHIRHAYLS
jgi:hypothetical protein